MVIVVVALIVAIFASLLFFASRIKNAVSIAPSGVLKLLLSFLQISTVVNVNYDIPWPNIWVDFLSSSKIFLFDILEVTSLNCVSKVNFYDSLVAVSVIPACLCFVLLILYVLAGKPWIKDKTKHHSSVEMSKKNLLVKIMFLVILVTYPGISYKSFQTFVCRDVGETVVIESDYSVQCFGRTYNKFAALAGLVIGLVPVGVPVALFIFLMRMKNTNLLNNMDSLSKFGHIYRDYKPELFWWECVELLRKLLATSVIVFLDRGSTLQIIFGLFMAIAFHLLHAICHPYHDLLLNILQHAFLFLIWFSLGCGLVMKIPISDSDQNQKIAIFLICAYLMMVICTLYCVVVKIKLNIRERRLDLEYLEEQKQKEEALEKEAAEGTKLLSQGEANAPAVFLAPQEPLSNTTLPEEDGHKEDHHDEDSFHADDHVDDHVDTYDNDKDDPGYVVAAPVLSDFLMTARARPQARSLLRDLGHPSHGMQYRVLLVLYAFMRITFVFF